MRLDQATEAPQTDIIWDEESGRWIFHRVQDVESIIEANKRSVNDKTYDDNPLGRHIASIPCIFIERWLNEEYARGNTGVRMFTPEFDKIVERKLRDPDWAWLRATDKRF
jgi:hypothetical protein